VLAIEGAEPLAGRARRGEAIWVASDWTSDGYRQGRTRSPRGPSVAAGGGACGSARGCGQRWGGASGAPALTRRGGRATGSTGSLAAAAASPLLQPPLLLLGLLLPVRSMCKDERSSRPWATRPSVDCAGLRRSIRDGSVLVVQILGRRTRRTGAGLTAMNERMR
jgi:hypothetical protein